MKRGTLLLAIVAATPALADADLYIAEVKRVCSAEWGTDYRMVEYCQNRQFEAMSAIKIILEQTANNVTRTNIIQTCIQEWPEGQGYDWAMAEYCYRRQIEAYERLNPGQ